MRGLVLAVLCGFAALLPAGSTHAQDSDVRPLMERLDRLERDMNMLQRQVYRGSGAPITMAPVDSQAALSNEVRIGQIEEQMRSLNGQLEQANYAIDQLRRRLEKLTSDIDVRFSQLEHPGSAAPPPTDNGAMADQVPVAPPPSPPNARGQQYSFSGSAFGGAPPGRTGPQPGILGTLPVGPGAPPPPPNGLPPGGIQQNAAVAPPPPGPAPAGASLPNGTPRQQFDYAFGLLRQANYAAAEQALRAFLQRYPNDELAGNAQYWLGKTYYVREDYNNAAIAFAEGYKKYPKSGKAQDNLLDLGFSLANLKRTEEACLAFSRFEREFPNAPANSRDQAATEKRRLGCKPG